jgi:NAD-dependent dihydropyrimidine dehydrogenase PreA subunit
MPEVKINRSPLKAIRKHCLECSGGSPQEVRLCPVETCPLYGFRFGHRLPRESTPGDGLPEKTQVKA